MKIIFAILAAMAWIPSDRAHSVPFPAEESTLLEREPAPSTHAQLSQWIEQLASDDYRVRERAADSLVQAGSAAEPLLREAAKSPHLEKQLQAQRILAMVVETERENRIRAFLNDVDGSQGISLPGWDRVRARLKHGDQLRKVFVKLYRAEPKLFATYEENLEQASLVFADRMTTLYNRVHGRIYLQHSYINQYPLASFRMNVLALLLVGTDPQLVVDPNITAQFDHLIQHVFPPSQSDKYLSAAILKELIGYWIVHRTTDGPLEYHHLNMGIIYDAEKAITLAERILQAKKSGAHVLAHAALCVAQFGDRRHVVWIEPLMDNKTIVISGMVRFEGKRINRTIQLQDVALAVAIRLTGQKYSDYGLMHVVEPTHPTIQVQSVYFNQDDDREKAFEKWHAWRASHP